MLTILKFCASVFRNRYLYLPNTFAVCFEKNGVTHFATIVILQGLCVILLYTLSKLSEL